MRLRSSIVRHFLFLLEVFAKVARCAFGSLPGVPPMATRWCDSRSIFPVAYVTVGRVASRISRQRSFRISMSVSSFRGAATARRGEANGISGVAQVPLENTVI